MTPAARALRRLSLSRLSRSPAYRPTPVVMPAPNRAGCSRWMTCSCCNLEGTKTYFSPNAAKIRNTHGASPSDSLSRPAEDPSRGWHDVQRSPRLSRAAALPLPPRLPYSPSSVPFKRHLELLSLAILSSSSQESWDVYLSLHTSLRRYIPDNIYRSLIAHQLRDERPKQRWIRTRSLIAYGQRCGMTLDDLGARLVEDALDAGLAYATAVKKGSAEGMTGILVELWASLRRLNKGDLSALSDRTKHRWIAVHRMEIESWRANSMSNRTQNRSPSLTIHPTEIIEDFVRTTGGSVGGIGRLLVAATTLGSTFTQEALRYTIWCIATGIDISDSELKRVVSASVQEFGREKVHDMCTEICSLYPNPVGERVRFTYMRTGQASLPDRLAGADVARGQDLAQLVPIAFSLLAQESPPIADLEAIFRLCQRFHADRDAVSDRLDDLYTFFAVKLHQAAKGPQPPEGVILRSAKDLATATTNAPFLHRILDALLALGSDQAYILARRAYRAARATAKPYTWTRSNFSSWRSFFHRTISTRHPQLHFASRLYADLLADDLQPYRQDELALVRVIARSKTASRPILLERHIRDFIEHFPDARVALARVLIEGLTARKIADDAQLAWTLVQRLLADLHRLPPEHALLLVRTLARGTKAQDRQAMLDIVRHSTTSAEIYDIAITSMVLQGRVSAETEGPSELSHDQALAIAGGLFRDMIARGFLPTSKTVSALMRGLIEVGQLDNATKLLQVTARSGLHIKSGVIGRLMINLAVDDRYAEAENVERVWRSTLGTATGKRATLYDKGVVGARAFMDIKRGRPVDLARIANETGWVPNASFREYLETMRQNAPARLVTSEHEESLEAAGQDTWIEGIEHVSDRSHQSKRTEEGRLEDISPPPKEMRFGLAHPQVVVAC